MSSVPRATGPEVQGTPRCASVPDIQGQSPPGQRVSQGIDTLPSGVNSRWLVPISHDRCTVFVLWEQGGRGSGPGPGNEAGRRVDQAPEGTGTVLQRGTESGRPALRPIRGAAGREQGLKGAWLWEGAGAAQGLPVDTAPGDQSAGIHGARWRCSPRDLFT